MLILRNSFKRIDLFCGMTLLYPAIAPIRSSPETTSGVDDNFCSFDGSSDVTQPHRSDLDGLRAVR